MPIVVHGYAASSCTQRVLTTLAEKNLDFQLKPIDPTAQENEVEKYFEENQPFGGVVPVLIDDDGFKVYASRAICRYLELKYKENGNELIPGKSAASRGLFEQAASIELSYFDPYASAIIYEHVAKKQNNLGEPDRVRLATMVTALNEKLDVYEKILASQPFLAGQEFSLADLFHLPNVFQLLKLGYGDLIQSRKNVQQWWDQISSRTSWKTISPLQ